MDTLAQLRAGRLAGAQRLALSCGLAEFPREIFALSDSLEVLDLSGNALDALPDDLGRLHKLRLLFCSNNRFTELPESIGQCTSLDIVGFKANRIRTVPSGALPPSLRWLILTDNAIETLPDSIGACTRMQKLMLAGNRLRALPDAMASLENLELLRISANAFEAVPSWLLSLPRLSWLAVSGNPFCERAEHDVAASAAIPQVDWRHLTLGVKLGEGASGVIYQAALAGDDSSNGEGAEGNDRTQPVAVKLFKGAVTSDGWPHSEMAASLAAGSHPNLVSAQGQITGHPDGTEGLLMALVDPAFRNLAGPPSFASCTRDVYSPDARWSPPVARRMALGIAAAMAHLHARGIVHGDLYAHNILFEADGTALLGDFGAAAMPGSLDAAQALALQRLEVRAFGCLLEELAERCDANSPVPDPASSADVPDAAAGLQALAARCLQPDVAARPSFGELEAALAGPAV
ncbi:leucine-rich repeat-containing protein kinase family protein [soil metagenome]